MPLYLLTHPTCSAGYRYRRYGTFFLDLGSLQSELRDSHVCRDKNCEEVVGGWPSLAFQFTGYNRGSAVMINQCVWAEKAALLR